MATVDLSAERRTVLGKKVKQLRRQGVVPANIYGRNRESVAIQAPVLELRQVLRSAGHTGLVRIALAGGAPVTTLVRGVRRKAVNGDLVHVDFQAVSMTEKMTVRIPLVFTGHAPATDQGAMILEALDAIEVECLPGNIPSQIEVDLSGLVAADSAIHVRDLTLPDNVELLTEGGIVVANVSQSAAEEAAEGAEEAGAEAAGAPAEAEAGQG